MLTNKDVRVLNEISLGTYNVKLGDYLKRNDFSSIEPFYSDRIKYNDSTVLDNACAMIVELSKKLDAKCTVTFDLSGVDRENREETYYIGEKITLPEVSLIEGKRLRFIDEKNSSVNENTIALYDMTVKASYIDNAYIYVKYFNANDRFNPYESVRIKLNGNIPAPIAAPVSPAGKTEFIGWFNEPQSHIDFTLSGSLPIQAVVGSPLSYQPPGVDLVAGDINLDGTFDVSDVIELLQMLSGTDFYTPSEYEKIVLDYNEDGKIDVSDVIEMQQELSGSNKSINISELCLYAWWR